MTERDAVDLQALSDLSTPWCVHVVATLRVADHLASGATEIGELALRANADAQCLGRVLRHLVGKGVFDEPRSGVFALNAAAEGLRDDQLRLGLDLDGFGGRMAHAWGSLLSATRQGRPAYDEIFGRPFWDDLDAHPDIAASFDELMGPAGHGRPDPDILLARDWDGVRTIVDVGGGSGALLAEVLRARPEVQGALVDLPRTVARSVAIFAAAGVAERARAVGQSFFDPLPAGADVYLLKSVLSDWPDPEAVAILRRCAEAARPNGRIVLLNGVSPDDAEGGVDPALLMLVLVGGRQRGLSEFRAIASEAGLTVSAAGRQPTGRFIVECRPV